MRDVCTLLFLFYAHEVLDEIPELATSLLHPLFFITELKFIHIFSTKDLVAGPGPFY